MKEETPGRTGLQFALLYSAIVGAFLALFTNLSTTKAQEECVEEGPRISH